MELLNGSPIYLWRAVCVFSVAAVVAGILLPGTPAVAIVLIITTLLLTGWALLVQRRLRRMLSERGPRQPFGA